jgi:hypothetical protein
MGANDRPPLLPLRRIVVATEAAATFECVRWFWSCATARTPLRVARASPGLRCGRGETEKPPVEPETVTELSPSSSGASSPPRPHSPALSGDAQSPLLQDSARRRRAIDGDGAVAKELAALPGRIIFWEATADGGDSDSDSEGDEGSLAVDVVISASTVMEFAYHRYRVTFSLDISPSVAVVDDTGSSVVAQRLFSSLEVCVCALTQPLLFVSEDGRFEVSHTPEVFVSVIAQGSLQEAYKVLLQGAQLTVENRGAILRELRLQTRRVEGEYKIFYALAKSRGATVHGVSSQEHGDDGDDAGNSIFRSSAMQRHSHGDSDAMARFSNASLYLAAAAEVALESALQQRAARASSQSVAREAKKTETGHSTSLVQHINDGVFALQQLPGDARSCLVLITDGVAQLPESCSAYGGLITFLNQENIPCCVVQVPGRSSSVEAPFGYVAYSEAMQYVATATRGSFFSIGDTDGIPRVRDRLLLRPFRFSGGREDTIPEVGFNKKALKSMCVARYELPSLPMTEILRLRYYEGYQLVSSEAEGTAATFRLCWHPDIYTLYSIRVEENKLTVVVCVQAPRDFLAEFAGVLRAQRIRHALPKSRGLRNFIQSVRAADDEFAAFYGRQSSLLSEWRAGTDKRELCRIYWDLMGILKVGGRWRRGETIDLLLITDDTPHGFSLEHDHTHDHTSAEADEGDSPLWKRGETLHSRRQQHERFLASLKPKGSSISQQRRLQTMTREASESATVGALATLRTFLTDWSSFANAPGDGFVRHVSTGKSSGFAVIRVESLTERFLTLHVCVHAASSELMRATLMDLRRRLSSLSSSSSHSRRAVALFEKPVRALLVNYDWDNDAHSRLFRFQSLQPSFPLLRAYLRRRRWQWHLPIELRGPALTLMSHARTHTEGFVSTNTSPFLAFVKQVALQSGNEDENKVPCIVQYVCYTIPAHDTGYCRLVYEFWMEPQWEGSSEKTSEASPGADFFTVFCDWIADADLRVVCALSSFHVLTQHAAASRSRFVVSVPATSLPH